MELRRWSVSLCLPFALQLGGCGQSFLPAEAKFAVAPGYVLEPALTAAVSILPLAPAEEDLFQPGEEAAVVEPIFSLAGFLRDEYALKRTGIYFTEPYDPEKIPILFVHGLMSDPYTWKKLTKRLTEDPEITDRYQFWYYAYSTSVPATVAASTLRGHLDGLEEKLRNDGYPSGLNRRIILCGHSLGGVVTKLVISSSGDELWDAAFLKPPRSLRLEPEKIKFLEETFFFEPHPTVARAIIMAAPIRGTVKARTPIAAIGRVLSNEPDFIGELMNDLVEDNSHALRPDFIEAYGKHFDSITALDPDAPLTSVFAVTSVDPEIPFHSISGVSPNKRKEQTDGLVPLESTLLEGAVSRVEIESNHAVHEKVHTAGIVKLILLHHVGMISEKQLIDGVEILGRASRMVPQTSGKERRMDQLIVSSSRVGNIPLETLIENYRKQSGDHSR